jgi:hypothetical protein
MLIILIIRQPELLMRVLNSLIFIACNNLSQLIKEPTRITQTRSSILDLIITDFPSLFVSNGTLSPPSNCDHNVVVGEMSIPIYRPIGVRAHYFWGGWAEFARMT